MQSTRNDSFSATTSSAEALPERAGRRLAFVITPVTAGVTIFIGKGPVAVATNTGIPVQVNQNYVESNSEGFQCWQGPIQILGSGAGTVAISETLRD